MAGTERRESADTTDDVDHRERYDRVLSTIQHNTGDPQPPGCTPRVLKQILVADGPYDDASGITSSLQAALNNEDVILWRDRDGRKRFTTTRDEDLRDLIGAENEYEHPATELIAQAAEHIDDTEGGDA